MTRTSMLLVVLGAVACSSRAPAPSAESNPIAMLKPAEAALLTDAGQLQVFTTNLATDGRRMRVRGFVHNPYPQRVDGVRLALRILSHADSSGRELDRFQRVLDGPIDAGQNAPVHWDIESGYGSVDSGSFDLQAFAVRRGDESLRLPPGWRP
jgi:hypothetical protein